MKKTKWYAVLAACVVALLAAGCSNEPDEEPSPWKIEGGVLIRYEGTDENVTIPAEVKEIGAGAFKGRTALKGVTIPEGVTKVGDGAFGGCTSLALVAIPEGVTEIGKEAFSGCAALASASIPNSVTVIGENPFKDCAALAEVTCAKNISGWSKLIVRRGSKEGFSVVQCADGEWRAGDMDDWQTEKINGKYTLVRYLGDAAEATVPNWISVIGEGAFKDKAKLTAVKILKNATGDTQYINANAFEGCASLASVEMPELVGRIDTDAFKGCADVDVSFAGTTESWTQVAKNANIADCVMVRCKDGWWCNPRYWEFYDYIDGATYEPAIQLSKYTGTAKTLRIPEFIDSFGDRAFTECENLECVRIPAGCGDLSFRYMLEQCETITRVELLDGVTKVRDGAFSQCERLTSVTIPASVETIGSSAFEDCTGLTSVTIPASVKTIGSDAFRYCTGLTSMTIHGNVTTIESDTFNGCKNLGSVTIPASVTTIDYGAFRYCENLKTVTYKGTLAQWCAMDKGVYDLMGYAEHVSMGDGTDLKTMPTLDIPNGVKSIGCGVFYKCEGLTSVTIPEGVESIDDHAFGGCTSLASVTIPASVNTIGYDAFSGSESYTSGNVSDVYYDGTEEDWNQIEGISSIGLKRYDTTIHGKDGATWKYKN